MNSSHQRMKCKIRRMNQAVSTILLHDCFWNITRKVCFTSHLLVLSLSSWALCWQDSVYAVCCTYQILSTVNSPLTDTLVSGQLHLRTLFSIPVFTSQSNSVFTHSRKRTRTLLKMEFGCCFHCLCSLVSGQRVDCSKDPLDGVNVALTYISPYRWILFQILHSCGNDGKMHVRRIKLTSDEYIRIANYSRSKSAFTAPSWKGCSILFLRRIGPRD